MAIRVKVGDKILEFPDGTSKEDMEAALKQLPSEGAPPPREQSGVDRMIPDALSQFASKANQGALQTLDFLVPGTVNAGLRLAGSDYQLPTFAGAGERFGIGADYMEPGMARNIVSAAGATLPAAGSMVSVPRNVASLGGAAAELTGFGSSAPVVRGGQEAQAMIARAQEMGWPLSPGEQMDSPGLRKLEASLESMPIPFNPMARQAGKRQDMINRVAAESIGAEPQAGKLTQETMGAVADSLGNEFKRLDLEEDILLDQQFHDRLAEVEQQARSRIFTSNEATDAIDKIMDKVIPEGALGSLSASEYQDISSELKKKVRQVYKEGSLDPQFADSLKQIIEALDDVAEKGLDPTTRERLFNARRLWRNLSALENSRAVRESGDVSGPLLANYLRRTDKGGYARGKNRSSLYDVARLSKAFPSMPDSGTATRTYLQNMMQHPLTAGAGLVGSGSAAVQYPIATLAATAAPSVLSNLYYYGMPAVAKGTPAMLPRAGLQANTLGRLFEDED